MILTIWGVIKKSSSILGDIQTWLEGVPPLLVHCLGSDVFFPKEPLELQAKETPLKMMVKCVHEKKPAVGSLFLFGGCSHMFFSHVLIWYFYVPLNFMCVLARGSSTTFSHKAEGKYIRCELCFLSGALTWCTVPFDSYTGLYSFSFNQFFLNFSIVSCHLIVSLV